MPRARAAAMSWGVDKVAVCCDGEEASIEALHNQAKTIKIRVALLVFKTA
jgi:hypothetical protein